MLLSRTRPGRAGPSGRSAAGSASGGMWPGAGAAGPTVIPADAPDAPAAPCRRSSLDGRARARRLRWRCRASLRGPGEFGARSAAERGAAWPDASPAGRRGRGRARRRRRSRSSPARRQPARSRSPAGPAAGAAASSGPSWLIRCGPARSSRPRSARQAATRPGSRPGPERTGLATRERPGGWPRSAAGRPACGRPRPVVAPAGSGEASLSARSRPRRDARPAPCGGHRHRRVSRRDGALARHRAVRCREP